MLGVLLHGGQYAAGWYVQILIRLLWNRVFSPIPRIAGSCDEKNRVAFTEEHTQMPMIKNHVRIGNFFPPLQHKALFEMVSEWQLKTQVLA